LGKGGLQSDDVRAGGEVCEFGKDRIYQSLKIYLIPGTPPAYRETAEKMGLTETNVKSLIRRLRQQFGRLLRREIADTLIEGENLDEEINYLTELLT
jgi:hypothetical protein